MKQLTKICTKCKQKKRLDKFNARSISKDGLTWECSECNRQRMREYNLIDNTKVKARRTRWNKNNPKKYKEINKKTYIKHKIRFKRQRLKSDYGLDYGEFLRIKEAQGNKCAVCREREVAMYNGIRKELAVDHCHETGEIRALLCSKCNTAIGLLNESAELCQKVADYLRRHKRIKIASA